MKTIHLITFLLCLSLVAGCGPDATTKEANKNESGTASVESETESGSIEITNQIVEASCGQCQFGMEGDGCDLAVRIDGKSYYVDGSNIDDHGDDGLCNCIRKAKVTGDIKNGRFVAATLKELPNESN